MKQWEIRYAIAPDAAALPVQKPEPSTPKVPDLDLGQLPIVVWTTDPTLTLTSANGSGLDALELGPTPIVGRTLFDLFQTDDHPVVEAHRLALAGQTVSFNLRLADRVFLGRVSPLHDKGEPIGTICALVEDASADDPAVVQTPSAFVAVG